MVNAKFLSGFLRERVKHIAGGSYTESDGGDWYALSPAHQRLGEEFANRDDAHRLILWLAGDPMPEGWRITKRTELSCDLDCGQGYAATIWTAEARRTFPARAKELVP